MKRALRARAWQSAGLILLTAAPVWGASGLPSWETYTGHGRAAYDAGRYAEAERMFVAALREARALGAGSVRLIASLQDLVRVYVTVHRYDRAEPLLREAIALQERIVGPNHPAVADLLEELVIVLENQGRATDALAIEDRIRAIRADPVIRPRTMVWVKPGGTTQDLEDARDACRRAARYGATALGPLVDADAYAQCMGERGWRLIRTEEVERPR